MKKTLYRIYTESNSNLSGIVSCHFANSTIIHGEGLYKGQTEKSSIIEISTSENYESEIVKLCEHIIKVNNQDCVLIVTIPIVEKLVFKK